MGKPYVKLLHDKFEEYMKDILDLDDPRPSRRVIIPKHLEDFVPTHIAAWGSSLITAMAHEEDKHYRVQKSTKRNNVSVVAPIDYKNTGQIQEGVHWSNGVHQFLQIRHELPLSPEGLVSVFMSYVGFALKYTNVYGLTATLGTQDHRQFLSDVYGVDSIIIPSFIKNKLKIYPPISESGFENWANRVMSTAIEIAKTEERPVLIIAKTIKEEKIIFERLKAAGYPQEKLFEYVDAEGRKAVEKMKSPGEIVVGTNIGGRATDIKLSKESEKNGGLHTIITSFPDSFRVQRQAQRRSARKEERGSTQIIIDTQTMPPECNGDFRCFELKRRTTEAETLKRKKICDIPYMMLVDELFEESVQLVRMVESPTGYNLVFTYDKSPRELQDDTFYIYAKDGKEIHLVSSRENRGFDLDITDSVINLDENTFTKVIAASTKDDGRKFIFNRKDFYLFHFIAAFNGHDIKKKAITRVAAEYEMDLSKSAGGYPTQVNAWSKRAQVGTWDATAVQTYLESKTNSILDTQEKINSAIEKVFYQFWKEDLKTHNKQTEVHQVLESFAIWLQEQTDVFYSEMRECEVYSEEATEKETAKFNKTAANMNASLAQYKSEIIASWKNDTLIKNPAHFIHRAFSLKIISDLQEQSPIYKGNKIQIFGKYAFLEEEPKSSGKGWWESVKRAGSYIVNKGSYIVNKVSNFFSGGEVETSKVCIENPLNKAVNDLQRAINIEEEFSVGDTHSAYSWPAHNAMAFIRLALNGKGIVDEDQANDAYAVKKQFITDTSNARNKLIAFEIPRRENELAFLILHNITNINSPLAHYYLWQIKVLNWIEENVVGRNINTTVDSGPTQMIYGSGFIQLRELKNINITIEVEGKEFASKFNLTESSTWQIQSNTTKSDLKLDKDEFINHLFELGVVLPTIGVFDLEKEEDTWIGAFFTGIIGAIQVVAGLAIMGIGGPFAISLGASFLMQGLSDILTAVEHIVTGEPIDLDSYFKSKAIGLAISLGTASFASILGLAPTAIGFKTAVPLTIMLRGFSYILEVVGDNLVASNDGEIEKQIRNSVSKFMREHERELNIICASTSVSTCEDKYDEIFTRAQQLINNHEESFHGPAPTIIEGIFSGVLGIAVGGSPFSPAGFGTSVGIKAGIGLAEASSLIGTVLDDLDDKVRAMARSSLTTKQIMQKMLKDSYPSDAETIMQILDDGNVFRHCEPTVYLRQVDTSDALCCTNLAALNLGASESKRNGIKSFCANIESFFISSANLSAKDNLSHRLFNALHERMLGVIHGDFVVPLAGFVASGVSNKIFDIQNKKDELAKARREAEEKYRQKREKQEFAKHMQRKEQARLRYVSMNFQNPGQSDIPWQNPDNMEDIPQKNFNDLNPEQQEIFRKYSESQFNKAEEGIDRLKYVRRNSNKAEEAFSLENYLNDMQEEYNNFVFDNPIFAKEAFSTLKTSAEAVAGSTSPHVTESLYEMQPVREKKYNANEAEYTIAQSDTNMCTNYQSNEYTQNLWDPFAFVLPRDSIQVTGTEICMAHNPIEINYNSITHLYYSTDMVDPFSHYSISELPTNDKQVAGQNDKSSWRSVVSNTFDNVVNFIFRDYVEESCKAAQHNPNEEINLSPMGFVLHTNARTLLALNNELPWLLETTHGTVKFFADFTREMDILALNIAIVAFKKEIWLRATRGEPLEINPERKRLSFAIGESIVKAWKIVEPFAKGLGRVIVDSEYMKSEGEIAVRKALGVPVQEQQRPSQHFEEHVLPEIKAFLKAFVVNRINDCTEKQRRVFIEGTLKILPDLLDAIPASSLTKVGIRKLPSAGKLLAIKAPPVEFVEKAVKNVYKTPPAIWSINTKKKLMPVKNAYKHWRDHRAKFPEFQNAKQYVEGAISFLNTPPKGSMKYIRQNSEKVICHPKSKTVGVLSRTKVPKTFLKPTANPIKYFKTQISKDQKTRERIAEKIFKNQNAKVKKLLKWK